MVNYKQNTPIFFLKKYLMLEINLFVKEKIICKVFIYTKLMNTDLFDEKFEKRKKGTSWTNQK